MKKKQPEQQTTTKPTQNNIQNINKRGPTTCIRLNEQEHKELTQISKETGKSIPQIFKEAIKKNKPAKPLMNIDEARNMIKELNRLGGNVNQIARKVNSGIYEGWYPMFQEFFQQHTQLFNLAANYGKGKR